MIYKSIKELKKEYANRNINKEQLLNLLRVPKDGCSNLTFNDSFAIFLYNRIIKWIRNLNSNKIKFLKEVLVSLQF